MATRFIIPLYFVRKRFSCHYLWLILFSKIDRLQMMNYHKKKSIFFRYLIRNYNKKIICRTSDHFYNKRLLFAVDRLFIANCGMFCTINYFDVHYYVNLFEYEFGKGGGSQIKIMLSKDVLKNISWSSDWLFGNCFKVKIL